MDIWNVLSDIVLLLSVALVLGMLFERLRQSAVTGYLISGLCLGPSGFGFIVNVAEVQALAEIGVALLLFTIGLEFSWRRLRELGAVPWMSGLLQIVITILLGTWVASIFGLFPSGGSGDRCRCSPKQHRCRFENPNRAG